MDAFAALADPVRRDLLLRLSRGSARVVDLAAERSISRPAVSRHLRLLAEAELVTVEDVGRERHYRTRLGAVAEVETYLLRLRGEPPVTSHDLDALETEVRRTVRERRADEQSAREQGESA